MSALDANESPGPKPSERFQTTHWSVVLAAANATTPGAQAALEELCRAYWYPLYAFIRRDGATAHDAQDLTQGFLARLIEKRQLSGIEAGLGKFRSFLLVTLKHYLSDERKRARAQKRGGNRVTISIDEQTAESRYRIEPADALTPDALFEREWALTVLEQVLRRVRCRYAARGREKVFDHLEPCLGGSQKPVSYAGIGAALGMDEGAVKVAAHRLRKEFGLELRAEIARTITDPAAIDAEIRQLIAVTSRLT